MEAVGETVWYWAAVQTVNVAHCRLDVVVAATVWYCTEEHMVRLRQARSDVVVGATL